MHVVWDAFLQIIIIIIIIIIISDKNKIFKVRIEFRHINARYISTPNTNALITINYVHLVLTFHYESRQRASNYTAAIQIIYIRKQSALTT